MSDILTVVSDLRTERDTLKAENEQLKAQLSTTWQPVQSEPIWGKYAGSFVRQDGILLSAQNSKDEFVMVLLPDDIRLCRKAATVAAEPVVDWSQYGQCDYFAIDENGEGYAFSQRPAPGNHISTWTSDGGVMPFVGNFNLNGVDWRATLTERPNQPPSGVTKA